MNAYIFLTMVLTALCVPALVVVFSPPPDIEEMAGRAIFLPPEDMR